MEILAVENLVFLVPLLTGIVWGALQFMGLADLDHGIDLDQDADAEAGAAGDADTGADLHAEAPTDADLDGVEAWSDTGDLHSDLHSDLHPELHSESDLSPEAPGSQPADLASHDLAHPRIDQGDSHTPPIDAHTHLPLTKGLAGSALVSALGSVLAILGIGKVPLSLLIQMWLLFWGVFGLIANRWFLEWGWGGTSRLLPAAGVALLGTLLLSRAVAGLFSRFLPTEESAAASARLALPGTLGTALLPIDALSGYAQVRLEGSVLQVRARVRPGEPALDKGTPIVIVDVDEGDGAYLVMPFDTSAPGWTTVPAAPTHVPPDDPLDGSVPLVVTSTENVPPTEPPAQREPLAPSRSGSHQERTRP